MASNKPTNTPIENPITKFSTALIPPESKGIECRSRFTKEMAMRSLEDHVSPVELLMAIAVDPNIRFSDFIVERGELKVIERGATVEERIDCAKSVLPYLASKKPVEIAHQGQIEILHSIAMSPLDAVMLDSEGRVIEDGEFEEEDSNE